MNTLITGVSNVWTAFVFGAVFNWLVASPDESLIYHAIKSIISGAIWLAFQILADRYKNKYAKQEQKNEHTENNEQKKET